MFSLEGSPTKISSIATSFLRESPLFHEDPWKGNVAVTIYRGSEKDRYSFLTAMEGVHQKEPMFGPWGPLPNSPYSFAYRENITKCLPHPRSLDPRYRIFLSWRGDDQEWIEVERKFNEQMVHPQRLLLESDAPVFPELWVKEREGRDSLRDDFRRVSAALNVDTAIAQFTEGMEEFFGDLLPHGVPRIAIYLNTPEGLILQRRDSNVWFPEIVPCPDKVHTIYRNNNGCKPNRRAIKECEDKENVFSWVFNSTHSAFIRKWEDDDDGKPATPSQPWRELLRRTLFPGSTTPIYSRADFGGMCIVPIPDLTEPPNDRNGVSPPTKSIGLLVLASKNTKCPIRPAHHFLLCRLAWSLATYLVPLLPLPGYPVWIQIPGRGSATIINPNDIGEEDDRKLILNFISSVMPKGSYVNVLPLSPGYAAKAVYKLEVTDSVGTAEAPRVLKIGEPTKIAHELGNYLRHVHNKPIGAQARVDVSKAVRDANGVLKYGAIVYHFLEEAKTWAYWARGLANHGGGRAELDKGIAELIRHLSKWWTSIHRQPRRKLKELLFPSELMLRWDTLELERVDLSDRQRETITRLRGQIEAIGRKPTVCQAKVYPFLIHGDLHASNVFAIARNDDIAVALIDWGSVREDGHPFHDFAQLLVDLVYRVLWDEQSLFNIDWALKQMTRCHVESDSVDHRAEGGCPEDKHRLALLYQMCGFRSYRTMENGRNVGQLDVDIQKLTNELQTETGRGENI